MKNKALNTNYLIFYLAISFLFLISCQTNKDENTTIFSNFNKTINLTDPEYFEHNLVGFYHISIIDSFIVLIHAYKPEEKILYIYNTNGQFIKSAIGIGKGPNEVGRIGFGFFEDPYNKELYIIDHSKYVIFKLNLYNLLNDTLTIMGKEIFLKPELQPCYSIAPLNNEKFVFCGQYDEKLLAVFNKNSKIEFYIGKRFVKKNRKWIDQFYSESYRVLLNVHPDKNKIVAAYRYFDRLEIYNIDGERTSTTIGPLNMKNEFVWKNGMRLNESSPIPAFSVIEVTDKYIFCAFPAGNKDHQNRYNEIINVYNWQGEPIAKLTFDQVFNDFGLDITNGYIYVNAVYAEKSIMFYKFNFNLLDNE